MRIWSAVIHYRFFLPRSGIPFDRFFVNMENIGNTSSASIPLALTDVQRSLRPDDKLVLCSVGAGLTTAAISVEW